jgi:hypothetical protein
VPEADSGPYGPPDPARQERDQPFELKFKGRYFSKPEQVPKMAIDVRRHIVHTLGIRIDEFFLNGVKLEDDYSDDKGESWHSHDWVADPDPEDEGLHPDIT